MKGAQVDSFPILRKLPPFLRPWDAEAEKMHQVGDEIEPFRQARE
jgi:hypothetical protein